MRKNQLHTFGIQFFLLRNFKHQEESEKFLSYIITFQLEEKVEGKYPRPYGSFSHALRVYCVL